MTRTQKCLTGTERVSQKKTKAGEPPQWEKVSVTGPTTVVGSLTSTEVTMITQEPEHGGCKCESSMTTQ